ncbi:hypothetical protein BKA65DRAFT_476009 [Rhexocercosporidium sp. MPI-PUGE-AT-0058]|nr:hypothetical protein BKA65DRAFT_476009 [Rhexocercosporidium sp. MPI-PUGE-AT-0058]
MEAKKPDPLADSSKRAAIMSFMAPHLPSPSTPQGKGKEIDTRPSLVSQYNAMTVKRGKITLPKACEGAGKCKNVLCDHIFAPVEALSVAASPLLDPKILKIVMDKSEKDGYNVSEGYAIAALQKNNYMIVPAIKEIKADIDELCKLKECCLLGSEYTLHLTGRINVPYERAALAVCQQNNSKISTPIFSTPSASPECQHYSLLKGRDEFISVLEREDQHLAEALKFAWASFYGRVILAARYKTDEQRMAALKVYFDEARWREERALFWEECRNPEQGLSADEVEVCMERWEEGKGRLEFSLDSAGVAGEDTLFRGSPWRRESAANATSITTQGESSSPDLAFPATHLNGESSSSTSTSTTPRTKIYHHPSVGSTEIIDRVLSASTKTVLNPIPEVSTETLSEAETEHGSDEENMTKLKVEHDADGKSRIRISQEKVSFYKQQEADQDRYNELMNSVASDDIEIAELRAKANALLSENKDLHTLNYDLKFRATQKLLGQIDNPPEPQSIFDLVTKIADWDLKFTYALEEDDLPVLYSSELLDLLDKLCKNIYFVSVQTIDEKTRPAIKAAWEAINFGGRSFHNAMALAVVIDRGLMEESLGDKLAKAIEMAIVLDETFQNLDIELPVLNRKAKRNRVEDKKLQGMLKQCLELSMKVCAYPKDLSWAGINKVRRDVGSQSLQKQMELKYMGLASSDPPTEAMNKKNAATYIELITAARKIDDLLKANVQDPVAKYKDMLKVFYIDKVHPASFLPNWKILIKDEETHNMIAMLMLIAADEDENKFGQVIQIFRECIHEDLRTLHGFVKNDPENFIEKTNYKFLIDVIGAPGRLKFDDLTDLQIWDWILGFEIAKCRLSGDVKKILGWAANFNGQSAVNVKARVVAEDIGEKDGYGEVKPLRAGSSTTQRPISTPRRVQQSLHKSLSKGAINSKVGKDESLEDAIERSRKGISTMGIGAVSSSGGGNDGIPATARLTFTPHGSVEYSDGVEIPVFSTRLTDSQLATLSSVMEVEPNDLDFSSSPPSSVPPTFEATMEATEELVAALSGKPAPKPSKKAAPKRDLSYLDGFPETEQIRQVFGGFVKKDVLDAAIAKVYNAGLGAGFEAVAKDIEQVDKAKADAESASSSSSVSEKAKGKRPAKN